MVKMKCDRCNGIHHTREGCFPAMPSDCVDAALDELPADLIQYGVVLITSAGMESRDSLRWRVWGDAAKFGETEVSEKRACGFRIFREAAI